MASPRCFPLSLITFVTLGSVAAAGLLDCGGESDPTGSLATEAQASTVSRIATQAATVTPTGAEQALEAADHFQLSGGDLQVTYQEISGVPVVVYRDSKQTLTFRGSEVTIDATPAGTLISVVILQTIDTGSVTFSVLIPRAQVAQEASTPVVTQAITAFHRFSVIENDDTGQLDQYTVMPLTGTASHSFIVDVPAAVTGIARGSAQSLFTPNN
jgi:hypothetical protein